MEAMTGTRSVQEYLDGIGHAKGRRVAGTLLELTGATAEEPSSVGSIGGFGPYHYE
jgi:hypothetical protein